MLKRQRAQRDRGGKRERDGKRERERGRQRREGQRGNLGKGEGEEKERMDREGG